MEVTNGRVALREPPNGAKRDDTEAGRSIDSSPRAEASPPFPTEPAAAAAAESPRSVAAEPSDARVNMLPEVTGLPPALAAVLPVRRMGSSEEVFRGVAVRLPPPMELPPGRAAAGDPAAPAAVDAGC